MGRSYCLLRGLVLATVRRLRKAVSDTKFASRATRGEQAVRGRNLGNPVIQIKDKAGKTLLNVFATKKQNFHKLNLIYGDLRGMHFDDSDFSQATLDCIRADKAVFDRIKGYQMNLATGACDQTSWRFADLMQADLSYTSFIGADFSGANLSRTSFIGSDLRAADFTGAKIIETNFRGCKLEGAKFDNATFWGEYWHN